MHFKWTHNLGEYRKHFFALNLKTMFLCINIRSSKNIFFSRKKNHGALSCASSWDSPLLSAAVFCAEACSLLSWLDFCSGEFDCCDDSSCSSPLDDESPKFDLKRQRTLLNYSWDLNIRYMNGQKEVGCQKVWFSNAIWIPDSPII